MKSNWKRWMAILLAFVVVTTTIQLPITLQAAEDDNPPFPTFTKATNGMGAISDIKINEKNIQITTSASGRSITLTLAFLNEGGIRLYDENENNELYTLQNEEYANVEVLTHTNKILYAQGEGANVEIYLDYQSAAWCLEIYTLSNENPIYTLCAEDLMMTYGESGRETVTLQGDIREGESFIGLGERYSGVRLNGKSYELWNKDCWSKGTDSYVNVPLMHSNQGYSIFYHSYYAAIADIGESVENKYSFAFGGPDLDIYLWTGTPLENLKSYTSLMGTSATIPEWATGYWAGGTSEKYWDVENSVNEQGETVYGSHVVLENVLQKYQAIGTTPSAVYMESSPKTNPKIYDIADSYGTKLLGWWHADIPWTKDGNQKYSVSYMKDVMGVKENLPIIKNQDGSDYYYYTDGTSGNRVRVDYTHTSAESLVIKMLGQTTAWKRGLDGLMVDYGELVPTESTFANGKTGAQMHNLQPYYYNKTMKKAWDSYNPEEGYLLFARAGAAGSQQYAALFGGDQRSTFTGLNQAIQGGISVNASGFSVWGSDIGGHQVATGITQTEELYLRWLGFATYSPLMRAHGQSMNDPWNYDAAEETSAQDAFQKYYWLRENMRNLIYSAIVQSNKDGTPMMQAMGLAFNEKGMFDIQDQYLFCNEILVAPVVTEGATSREVILPTGNWYDLLTGEKFQGNGTSITVQADQDVTPAFVRSGAVIPMDVSSESMGLSDAMTEENRTEILLVTLAEKGESRTSTWWKNESDSVQFVSSFDGKTQMIRASEGKKPTIVKVYDTTATHVYVDGVELREADFYKDKEGHLFITLPSENWKEIKIEAEDIWDYEFSLQSPYEDVKYLDKGFEVYHFAYKDNTNKPVESVLGPIVPSKINEESSSNVEYFTTQYYGNYSQGYLKPTATSGGMSALTYKNHKFTDFEAEYEMLTSYNIFGLAFGGEKGIFPVSLDGVSENDAGVIMYMTKDGKMEIAGAIDNTDKSHCTLTMYKNTTVNARFSGSSYVYTKDSMTGKTIEPKAKPGSNPEVFTICVRVEDGWLQVWEKNHPKSYVRVQLSETYQGGYVSLLANQTDHGAFKAFRIRSLEHGITHQIDFDDIKSVEKIDDTFTAYHILNTDGFTKTWNLSGDISTLKDDFDSYYFEDRNTAAKKMNIESQWFTSHDKAPSENYATSKYANDLLKPIRNKTDSSGERYSLLTLKNQKVSDFTAKVTYVTSYYEYGVMFAPARTVGKGSNGFKVYVNSSGKISITGMLDMESVAWSGEGNLTKTTYTVQTPSAASYKSPDKNAEQKYTLVVCVKDGWITAYLEGFAGEIRVKLKENFVGDHISIYSNGYSQGGFEQFELTVDKGDVLSTSGRPSTYWNNSVWKLGSDLGSDAGYLQPNHRNAEAKRFTFLSYEKDSVYDFETEIEIANNHTRYGVSVAPAGEKFSSTNGIGIYVNSKGLISIAGAVDKEKAIVSDGTKVTIGSASVQSQTTLKLPSVTNAGTANTVYTLCVSHKKGIVTAYVKEYPSVQLSVPTTSAYKGGVISLYSTGNNQGGFKSWKFDTYQRDTVYWEKSSVDSDVAFVLRTDFPYKHVAAVVKYDAENYEYKIAEAKGNLLVDVRERAEGELVVFADTKGNDEHMGDWLTIVFEAKGERTSAISAITKVCNANAKTEYVKIEQNFKGDVDGNEFLDVLDLVRLKKYSLDASTEIHETNAKLHPAVDLYSDDNVLLMRKKLTTH